VRTRGHKGVPFPKETRSRQGKQKGATQTITYGNVCQGEWASRRGDLRGETRHGNQVKSEVPNSPPGGEKNIKFLCTLHRGPTYTDREEREHENNSCPHGRRGKIKEKQEGGQREITSGQRRGRTVISGSGREISMEERRGWGGGRKQRPMKWSKREDEKKNGPMPRPLRKWKTREELSGGWRRRSV